MTDSLSESVIAKRAQLAEIQKQNAERSARIAALEAQKKPDLTMDELLEKAYGPKPPEPPPRTEAEERAAWDKAEAERSAMQQSAGCGFDAAKLFPEMYPEKWHLPDPPKIAPEPAEFEVKPIKVPGVGTVATVVFSANSKMSVRVLSQPDAHGFVKCTPCSGMMVGHVVEISVGDFL